MKRKIVLGIAPILLGATMSLTAFAEPIGPVNEDRIPVEPVASVTEDADYEEEELVGASVSRFNPFDTTDGANNNFAVYPATRNQSPFGTCWAHAAMGMRDIQNTLNNAGDNDGSEIGIAYYLAHNIPGVYGDNTNDKIEPTIEKYLETGANDTYAYRILMNGANVTPQEKLPYPTSYATIDGAAIDAAVMASRVNGIKGGVEYDLHKDTDIVKTLIKTYGAVNVGYYEFGGDQPNESNDPFFNEENAAYYYDGEIYNKETEAWVAGGKTPSANHDILIVGWDDNYPSTNFGNSDEGAPNAQPTNNGAWLIRNSWQTEANYSHSSYFWISYESVGLEPTVIFIQYDHEVYDNIYGHCGALSFMDLNAEGDKISIAGIFTAERELGERLQAVSFEVRNPNVDYTVRVYRDLTDMSDPTSGELVEAATTKGKTKAVGAYRVDLKDEVVLYNGETYSVVIELNKSGGVKFVVEFTGDVVKAANATANSSGKTFYNDSRYEGWYTPYDLMEGNGYGDIVLHAYTDDNTAALKGIKINPDNQKLKVGESFFVTAYAVPSDAAVGMINLVSSDETIVAPQDDGSFVALRSGSATITASYGEISDVCTVTVEPAEGPDVTTKFGDVRANGWYVKAIQYVVDHGLMSGVGEDKFAPDSTCTREMFATILYSAEGKRSYTTENPFKDNKKGSWYYDALIWAYENKLTSGVSKDEFGIKQTVTREMVATFLMKYAQYKGYNVSAKADISGYKDAGEISKWAKDSIQWACGNGIMSGLGDGRLAPTAPCTRAQVAQMLMSLNNRYHK